MGPVAVRITRWSHHAQPKGRTEEWSWLTLCESSFFTTPLVVEKASARPGWASASFRDDYRLLANVEAVYGLGFDLDNCPSVVAVADEVRGLFSIVHSTWSHNREKRKASGEPIPPAPRCRVIFPLSREVTAGEYRALWAVVADVLRTIPGVDVDQAASDPSRLFYVPCIASMDADYEVYRTPRSWALDADWLLSLIAEEALQSDVERRARAYIAHRPGAVQGQGGSKVTYQVAVDLVRGFALPADVALRVMEQDYNPRCTPAWSRAELEHKVSDAGKARAELGYLLGDARPEPPVTSPSAGKSPAGGALPLLTGAALAVRPPPVPWLVRALQLAPGRPTLLSAFGGAGKTFGAMDIALAIATGGGSCLGSVPVTRRGRVVHLNWEMSEAEVLRRYQRLAFGRGVSLEGAELGIASRLQLGGFALTSGDAKARLVATCTGALLCIVDSLRAAVPGVEENSSEIRIFLDLLLEVSDATGCTFLVIHHEGKPDKEGTKDAIFRARGSGAIVDACDTTWHIVSQPNEMLKFEQGKVSRGSKEEPIYTRLQDRGERLEGDDRSEGIVFDWVPPEQQAQEVQSSKQAQKHVTAAALREKARREKIVEIVCSPRTLELPHRSKNAIFQGLQTAKLGVAWRVLGEDLAALVKEERVFFNENGNSYDAPL